jgi:septum site-determining protein MinC
MYTFMSLKLYTSDMAVIDAKLADKVQQAPGFFKDTPIVIDLSLLEEKGSDLDGGALLECIRRHRLVPIVASVGNKSSPLAQSIAIPLIETGVRRSSSTKAAAGVSEKSAEKRTAAPGTDSAEASSEETGDTKGVEKGVAEGSRNGSADESSRSQDSLESMPDLDLSASREVEYVIKSPLLIDKPVRSGQQVYARDTDLIVMGQVGPGAEVIADNNIHIYGPLRGRALCGVSGNTATRIFCQSLEAELVSVAGNYRMLETIPEELRGKPAQIWLDKDRLNIEPL